MRVNAWRGHGFSRVCFTRPWGNREGTARALPYIERIDDYGNSVLYVYVFFFVLNSEQ